MLIQQTMIFALGFTVALLAVLLFLPAFWARAIRLSVRRVAEQMPLTMAEITAERDGLRAESAIVQRRLEQERDRAVAAQTALRSESGRQIVKIADVEATIEIRRRDVFDLEGRLKNAESALVTAEAALTAVQKDHYDSSGLLERTNRTMDQLQFEMQRARDVSDQRRVTIAALETRTEALQAKVQQLEADLREADRRAIQMPRSQPLPQSDRDLDVGEPRAFADHPEVAHEPSIGAKRDDALVAQAARLEAQMKRVRLEHAEAEQQLEQRIEELRAGKYAIETELEAMRRDRDAAQRELRLARAGGSLGPSAENEDLALLRRSIVDVAADVVRLMGGRDTVGAATQANVLQLRRERAGRDLGGKPSVPAEPGTGPNQTLGAKLS